ncbi:hypothetical protein P5P86_12260 [Nocardioides sp. BP30]|uniref:hypothetical protein n=1 Tax=Nocardioides sp. BP30 TaxID=3036374 RepID=UPI00246998F6|nr:hypothetical protein [Nocardioides sp. BP30]WGL50737.1 hypothetical protein P5P86_12260 [Nocardioides sp. BP30]
MNQNLSALLGLSKSNVRFSHLSATDRIEVVFLFIAYVIGLIAGIGTYHAFVAAAVVRWGLALIVGAFVWALLSALVVVTSTLLVRHIGDKNNSGGPPGGGSY